MIVPFEGKEVHPYMVTCIDIETSPEGEIIGIGFAYQNMLGLRTYESFETTIQWLKSYRNLLQRCGKSKDYLRRYSRIFAHNGANFDYLKLYEEFNALDCVKDAKYFTADSAGLGCVFELKEIPVKLYLMDSYRLMPASLAKLGETYATDNQKQNVPEECKDDYLLFKQRYPDLFWNYLRSDVLSLQEIIFKFWSSIFDKFGNVGQLPMTLPALSLRVFSKSLENPILCPSNPKLKDLERRAYKGGMTICFKTGVFENVNVYDVNSMYPYAMVQHEYPCDYAGYWTHEFEPDSMGLWEVEHYEQSNEKIPPFLFDTTNGVSYKGAGVFTTNELNALERMGGTYRITQGYVYEKKAPIFRDFISTVYADRKKAQSSGNEALSFTLKIMMNSLYGKFAQREIGNTIEWYTYDRLDEYVNAGKRTKIMGDFLVTEEERDVPHVFVAIAAMITANARIDLHTRMCEVMSKGYQVFYCDTDSIHTDGSFDESLELGGIKLEKSGRATYAGKKLYAFEGGTVRAKGIGRNQVGTKLTFDVIQSIALDKGLEKALTFKGFPSVKGVLSHKDKAAVMRLMTRTIRNTGGIWDYE